jgi:hypothetical protein
MGVNTTLLGSIAIEDDAVGRNNLDTYRSTRVSGMAACL